MMITYKIIAMQNNYTSYFWYIINLYILCIYRILYNTIVYYSIIYIYIYIYIYIGESPRLPTPS